MEEKEPALLVVGDEAIELDGGGWIVSTTGDTFIRVREIVALEVIELEKDNFGIVACTTLGVNVNVAAGFESREAAATHITMAVS